MSHREAFPASICVQSSSINEALPPAGVALPFPFPNDKNRQKLESGSRSGPWLLPQGFTHRMLWGSLRDVFQEKEHLTILAKMCPEPWV